MIHKFVPAEHVEKTDGRNGDASVAVVKDVFVNEVLDEMDEDNLIAEEVEEVVRE